MPVSEDSSSPARQAIMLGLGLLAVIAMFVFFLTRFSAGENTPVALQVQNSYVLADADELAKQVAETGPFHLADLARGLKPVVVTHTGETPQKGWSVFSSLPDTSKPECVLDWDPADEKFIDACTGETYSSEGEGLKQYEVLVSENNKIQIKLG